MRKKILNFNDRIWKTSKSRMNTADRLKNYDFYSQLLIVYYSLCLIVVTISDIYIEKFEASIPTLILSITILVISVYIYAMDFGKRAVKVQNTYVEMQRILNKTGKYKDTKNLEEQYYNILDCSENHNTCDYLKVMYSVRNNGDNDELNGEFIWDKYIQFYMCKIKDWLLIVILFLLPIFIGLFYKDLYLLVEKII
ncbi:MAG TPA: SLATT domain-containing protein [Sulfurovum sp.]|nr:SLATT domain-containing protein [Sulfurovum sp.]